jgi:cytochrome c oxidase assembly factor CtaG
MRAVRPLIALILIMTAMPASAHEGHVHWLDVRTTWTLDPWVILPLALSAGLYGIGAARLWRRAGRGHGVKLWQMLCFASGWALLAVALVSPLHWLGERLFVAHMIEHEILMAVGAPLMMAAQPAATMLWAFPRSARRWIGALVRSPAMIRTWRHAMNPAVATALHGVALWIWHVPVLYEMALRMPRVHWLQHLSFLLTALLFWRALFRKIPQEWGYGVAVMCLLVTSLHSGLLGLVIALARHPLYPLQTNAALEWGLTASDDQQLAGLVMWVPTGVIYAVAALALAALWIARSGRRERMAHVLSAR